MTEAEAKTLNRNFSILAVFLAFLGIANAVSLSTWGSSLDLARPLPFIIDLALFLVALETYANRRSART